MSTPDLDAVEDRPHRPRKRHGSVRFAAGPFGEPPADTPPDPPIESPPGSGLFLTSMSDARAAAAGIEKPLGPRAEVEAFARTLFGVLLIPDPPELDGWSGGRYSIVGEDPQGSGLVMREDPNLPGHYLIEGGLL